MITADHGELFGEEGLLAHMLTTQSAVSNVPLVVDGIDGLPEKSLVQHADIMETICTEVGVDHPVPVGQDIRQNPREAAFTQRGGQRARKKLDEITGFNPHLRGYGVPYFRPHLCPDRTVAVSEVRGGLGTLFRDG